MLKAFIVCCWLCVAPIALADQSRIPVGYKLVWSDEFKSLSLRSGGPSYYGLAGGTGTWSAPGAWYSEDPRGVEGYGYDWFVDPSYNRWPPGYPATGQFTITPDGLRIRAEPPSRAMAAMLPVITKHQRFTPWLAGQISSYHAVRIRPPFYFEARAKMPVGKGAPFPAIWLVTGLHRPSPLNYGKEYEIDVHEGFGDSNRLHSTIHWNLFADKPDFPSQSVVDMATVDLSADFNTWGCEVSDDQQVFYFNGEEVGRVKTPKTASAANQDFGIMLDVSAGLPWRGGGLPSGGPHDMIVRYVRLYAPNASGLKLRN